MNHTETAIVIGLIRQRYPRSVWGDNEEMTVEVWHMSLGDLPLAAVRDALKSLFNESQFAPDPVDIRLWVAAATGVAPEPGEAWALAQGAIANYYPGFNNPPTPLPDSVRAALNAIGGIHNLRMSEEPERDRDAFMRVYASERKAVLSTPGLGLPSLPEAELSALTESGS